MREYLKETWRNKLIAVLITIIGIALIPIDYDATASVMIFIMALYLFFEKKNVID